MNCKPGDLALAIPPSLDAGIMVTCIEALLSPSAETERLGILLNEDYPLWHVDRPATWVSVSGRFVAAPFIPDRHLLALRPPASDESDTADQDLPAECGA